MLKETFVEIYLYVKTEKNVDKKIIINEANNI